MTATIGWVSVLLAFALGSGGASAPAGPPPRGGAEAVGPRRVRRGVGLLPGGPALRVEPLREALAGSAGRAGAEPAARGRRHVHPPAAALRGVRGAHGALRLR